MRVVGDNILKVYSLRQCNVVNTGWQHPINKSGWRIKPSSLALSSNASETSPLSIISVTLAYISPIRKASIFTAPSLEPASRRNGLTFASAVIGTSGLLTSTTCATRLLRERYSLISRRTVPSAYTPLAALKDSEGSPIASGCWYTSRRES